MIKLVPMLSYRAQTQQISALAWSPDGEHLALVSREAQALAIIQTVSAREVAHSVHTTSINAVEWSPDNTLIALGGAVAGQTATGSTGEVLVLDLHQQPIARVSALSAPVSALAWSPNNACIGIAAGDVSIWSVEHRRELASIRARDGQAAGYVGWSQDSKHLLVAWSARGQEIERTLTIHEAATGTYMQGREVDISPKEGRDAHRGALSIRSLALAPGRAVLAAAGVSSAVENDPEAPLLGIISILDLLTGDERRLAAGIFGRVQRGPFTEALSWSYDRRFLAASGWLSRNDTLLILDATTGNIALDFTLAEQGSASGDKRNASAVRDLAWSPVDARLAVTSNEVCRIYQAQEWKDL